MARIPNWVQKRAECTIEIIFNELIRQIRSDVSWFNSLEETIRKNRLICISDRKDMKVISEGESTFIGHENRTKTIPLQNTDNEILIKIDGNKIIADLPRDKGRIEINPVWNKETLTCDLYNGDKSKAYPLYQVSQMIIGDFLFGDTNG